MDITVTLPCSPLVYQYLINTFGVPTRLHKRCAAGRYFFRLVDHPSNQRQAQYASTVYKSEIKLLISDWDFRTNGCELTKTDIADFNNMITDHIYECMAICIETQAESRPDFTIIKAIHYFGDRFNLPQEVLSLDAAKKAYYRYRNRQEAFRNK